jgi:2-polyprenyl-3-methyl-5-hydroxy-6-metoxy-1,4-benzoquinol methylase
MTTLVPALDQLEEPACPLCQSEESMVAYGQFPSYGVVQCSHCQFYYLSPRLTESAMLREYQKDNYFEGEHTGYDSYKEQEAPLRATFRRLLQAIKQRGVQGQSLLEVGCGYGYLLDEARQDFSIRVGTDFSAYAVEQARPLATHVYCGDVASVPTNEQFDCVISAHVIEHVYDPEGFLRSLKAHIRPGGSIVIATPNMGSPWRLIMGSRWPSFKLPEHVLYFDRRSLSNLMQRVGFTNLRAVPYPHAFPLPLVANKLGIRLPKVLGQFSLWLPGTTLAIAATCPNSQKS